MQQNLKIQSIEKYLTYSNLITIKTLTNAIFIFRNRKKNFEAFFLNLTCYI